MDTMKDTTMQHVTDAVIEELRELAEDLYVNGYNRYSSAMSQAADKLEQLRAKIERMEQQEPAGKFIQHPSNGLWEQDGYGDNPDARPLYALPGAQGEEK